MRSGGGRLDQSVVRRGNRVAIDATAGDAEQVAGREDQRSSSTLTEIRKLREIFEAKIRESQFQRDRRAAGGREAGP